MTDKEFTTNYGFQIPPDDGDSYQDEDDLRVPITQIDTTLKGVADGIYAINHRPHVWDILRASAVPSDNFNAGQGFVSVIGSVINDTPPGDYLIYLTLITSGNAADNDANVRMQAGEGDSFANLGDPKCDLSVVAKPVTFIMPVYNWLGGSLPVTVWIQVLTGVGTIYKNGSHVIVQYLGPR